VSHSSRSNNFEKAEQGRKKVVAKISALGAQDIESHREGHRVYIYAKNANRTKQFRILSRTCIARTGRVPSWHASITDAKACDENIDESNFWVFVAIETSKPDADFYVVPEWWIKNNIYTVHQAYLARCGGRRKINPNSPHHAVKWERIKEWFNRWDLLRIDEN